MDRLTGRTLGPYLLVDLIGQGGMGAVYRAIHRGLNQPRAVKVLPPQFAQDRDAVLRFQREATIAASLRHPNIVLIYDIGEQDNLHYIAMELLDGLSLRDLIQQQGALPVARALHILAQLADALDYAHARNVIHRDLKPANVILTANDHVTLVDFGIAYAAGTSRLTQTGMVVGTPEYMAPEIVSGQSSGASVDHYALGVVAYELLTGRTPFRGRSSAMIAFVEAFTPPSPRQLRPDLPVAVEQVLLRQLALDPAQRYPTARAFVEALRAAFAGATAGPTITAPVSSPGWSPPHLPTPPPYASTPLPPPSFGGFAAPPAGPTVAAGVPTPRQRSRRPLVAILLVVLGVLVIAGVGLAGVVAVLGGLARPAAPATATRSQPAINPPASPTTALVIGTWVSTGRMATAHAGHTASLLANGKVLVVGGGEGDRRIATAELYDPASGTWSPAGQLARARALHAAITLPDRRVLVIGGDDGQTALTSTELYDPTANNWRAGPPMAEGRAGHTATLLANGKVLVVGGYAAGYTRVGSAELFDPATGTWSSAGRLATPRAFHIATLLPNGKVLVAGGDDPDGHWQATAELYDPATNSWTRTGSLVNGRGFHTATLLTSGLVLVVGGANDAGVLASTELYDPATGTWKLGANLAVARRAHVAVTLPNNHILVIGGLEQQNFRLPSVEIYDPNTGVWQRAASLGVARALHTATVLPDGKVLVAGGGDQDGQGALASAELFDLAR